MIRVLEKDYPVKTLCEVLDCPRSSYYYEAQAGDDTVLREAIESLHAEWPFYGYRRVTAELARRGLPINSKVVRRIMGSLDIHGKVGQVRAPSTTNSRHGFGRYPTLIQNLQAKHPDHLWVADITYLWVNGRFFYLAVVLDVCTRSVRGWHLGRTLSHTLALTALQHALAAHGAPLIHHSDQGIQYASTPYVKLLKENGCQISMSAPGKPTQNAFAERFMRTFKEEHYDYTEYTDFDDAAAQVGDWIERVYNTLRIHSALGYLTPTEFEAAFQGQPVLIPA